MAGSIIFTDSWEPGHWCGAALQLCAEHLVEGEEEDTRYPEQWIYLLWRPTARAVPFNRPDGWGLTVGHPQHEMRESLPEGTAVYLLADEECVWSSWLTIPLACDRFEPWLVAKIHAHIASQKLAESSRYAAWYGNRDADFQRFLNGLSGSSSDPLP